MRAGRPVPVVLIRHAQSEWNRANRFTGWANPPLTEHGEDEARAAAQCLLEQGFRFDVAFSSRLQRAVATRDLLLTQTGQQHVTTFQDWRLNERHYGALQGRNKDEMLTEVGEQQVWRWRRSYLEMAEALQADDPTHPRFDPLYADVPAEMLPSVENLAQTRRRVAGFWREHIEARIRGGECVLISAHGNTLRALLMELAGMSISKVEAFEIPTATPIVYWFNRRARPLNWHYLQRDCGQSQTA